MTIKSIAVLGSGAVGGYFGARLQQAGFDLHFLLHSDYEHVKENGLNIRSCKGDFSLAKVQAYQSTLTMPKLDMVIIAYKTGQNLLLDEQLPPLLHENSIVALLQNGIGEEEKLLSRFKIPHLISGLCFICSTKTGPGQIWHQDSGSISLAYVKNELPLSGMQQKLLKQVQSVFEKGGIPARVEKDYLLARFKKLIWNVPFNGLSVVLNADTQELIKDPKSRALCLQLMREVQKTAACFKREIPEDFIQQMIDYTEKMKPYLPSMRVDFDQNRKMELDSMYLALIQLAEAKDYSPKSIIMLYQQLCFLETRKKTSKN